MAAAPLWLAVASGCVRCLPAAAKDWSPRLNQKPTQKAVGVNIDGFG
jgi:hypothetical protein